MSEHFTLVTVILCKTLTLYKEAQDEIKVPVHLSEVGYRLEWKSQ